MKFNGFFWLFTIGLLGGWGVLVYLMFYTLSPFWFFVMEGLLAVIGVYLYFFYRRLVKPLRLIGNGMDLLKEQDFSSRLGKVGQPEADRVVDIFNKMMEQLKEERLRVREKNHLLDLLIDVSPMGVVILDPEERILSVNPAACRMLEGNETDEIIGRFLPTIVSPLGKELAEVPLYESQTVRLSDANVYKCTHASFIDRGCRHRFYLIERLTHEVFKAEKKAYEQVIRLIAHEVNNTTGGILSVLDTLQATVGEEDELAEVLRIAMDRCCGMSRFITRFADVVRIPEPEPVKQEVNALVGSCLQFMDVVCRERQIRLVPRLAAVSPVAFLDAVLFQQVLVNIIKNAAESIGEKGTIYIRTVTDPPALEIADTGKGIDKPTEAKLFSPFFSTKPQGQGLGLLFIREVLSKQGCSFSLRTYPDGLTRFKIGFAAAGSLTNPDKKSRS